MSGAPSADRLAPNAKELTLAQTAERSVNQGKPISERAKSLVNRFTGWVRRQNPNPDAALQEIAAFPVESTTLENVVSKYTKETFPGNTFLTPTERRMVFHGTRESHVDNFKAGFYGKSGSHATFTHDIGIAVAGRFTGGDVLVWDPPSEFLSQGDRVNLAITNPQNIPGENPSRITRKGNSRNSKLDTYLPAEHFAEVLSFTPDQVKYLENFSLNLKSHPETLRVDGLDQLVAGFTANFPNPDLLQQRSVREGFSVPVDRLLRILAVKTYESGLKFAAATAQNKLSGEVTDRKNKLDAFPTFGVPAYEDYKVSKISSIDL